MLDADRADLELQAVVFENDAVVVVSLRVDEPCGGTNPYPMTIAQDAQPPAACDTCQEAEASKKWRGAIASHL